MHEVQTADTGDLAALRDAARDGRAAAVSRRRALAAGQSAPALGRLRTGFRGPGFRAAAAAGDAPLPASIGQYAPVPAETPVAINGVAAARLGRALSMERRRQMSQGKQALNGGGDRTPAGAGAEARAFIVYRGGAS